MAADDNVGIRYGSMSVLVRHYGVGISCGSKVVLVSGMSDAVTVLVSCMSDAVTRLD